jgi:hypothetical protein
MPADWEATSVHNLVRTLDFVRAPFLHGRAVYGLSLMLQVLYQPLRECGLLVGQAHTSNAIQLMGSSLGISVFFTNSSFNVSSSNATVIITPGGVHVPIIRWCLTIVQVLDVMFLESVNLHELISTPKISHDFHHHQEIATHLDPMLATFRALNRGRGISSVTLA